MKMLALLIASLVFTSGCSSSPVTGAAVAFCEDNPHSRDCPKTLRRAKEEGVVADAEALASLRERSRSADEGFIAMSKTKKIRRLGRMVDVQIVNRGTPGTNAGAVLGSATAQAGYIGHTFSGGGSGYRATGQLGVGILGAMIGSAIDQPSEKWFELHYWIDFGNGPEEVVVAAYSPVHPPKGTCVRAHLGKVEAASETECRSN